MYLKTKTFTMLAALAVTGLASCSSEEPIGGDNLTGGERHGIGYMSFTLASPADGTRADGDATVEGEIFNNGDADEYAICPNKAANAAFFFYSDGKFYGMSLLEPVNQTGNLDSNKTESDDNKVGHESHGGYPEQFYTYVTRWNAEGENGDDKPAKVMVVLNADPVDLETLASTSPTVSEVLAKNYATRDEAGNYVYGVYKYGDRNYFTMSNSSYFEADNSTDATVQTLTDANICETPELALQAPVTVYVERLLAKFSLGFGTAGEEYLKDTDFFAFDPFAANPPEGQKAVAKVNYATFDGKDLNNLDYPSYEQKAWKAYIVNWGINGQEKNGNLIKEIEGTAAWNAFNYHRSYWGKSPLYSDEGKGKGFTTQYRPTQYDPENNDKFYGNETYNPAAESAQLNALHYVSFNELKNRARYKYTAERTYDAQEGLVDYGPYRYASHYLIGAQLLLDGVDNVNSSSERDAKNPGMIKDVADKYYAYSFFWASKDDYIRYSYRRMATQLSDGRAHTMKITDRTNGITLKGLTDGYLYSDDKGTRIEVADAADYFTLTSAQSIHGDGKVVLTPAAGKKIYLHTGENVYQDVTNYMVDIVYTFTEPARHYNKGAMYYAIPVQHNQGKTNVANRIEIKKTGGEYKVADFGVVRNHWYRLTVKTIGSIGTPVDNPDQPIIPDPEDEYYVALEIVVLPWHIINNGTVDL